MSTFSTQPQSGPALTALEGSNLTEAELEEIFEVVLEQMLEDRIRGYFADHCRRPLNRIEDRLRGMNQTLEKISTHGG